MQNWYYTFTPRGAYYNINVLQQVVRDTEQKYNAA